MKPQKKVMVFGTFDILHPGHIHFLKQAKKYGEFLIVSIGLGENVEKIKGHAPCHTNVDRKKLVEAVKYVDKAVLGAESDYLKHILKYRPQVIALGYDQKAYTTNLQKKLEARGLKAKVVRLKPYKIGLYSSRNHFKELKGD